MEKATLEAVVQRLDRLEKIAVEMRQQLSWLVDEFVPKPPKNCKTGEEVMAYYGRNKERNAKIAEEVLDRIFEKWGSHPISILVLLRKLRESMRQHGIRAEDNEFSRAIIAEREE